MLALGVVLALALTYRLLTLTVCSHSLLSRGAAVPFNCVGHVFEVRYVEAKVNLNNEYLAVFL